VGQVSGLRPLPLHNSLIWGENLEDVSITGPGRIWGKGLVRSQRAPQAGQPTVRAVGNKALVLKLCRNVILRDFSILNGGWFGILATGVDNMTISNLKIDTNRDGMDIISCRHVRTYIEDVKLNNIRIFYQGAGSKAQAAIEPKEEEKGYPEPRMFGDMPAFHLQSVKDVDLNNVRAQHAEDVPLFVLRSVEDFGLRNSPGIADTHLKSVDRKEF
jgi:hypothetical protein